EALAGDVEGEFAAGVVVRGAGDADGAGGFFDGVDAERVEIDGRDAFADPAGEIRGGGGFEVGAEDDEDVALEADGLIGAAAGFAERLADLAEDIVGDVVPDGVVDAFESVDVDHEQGPRMAGAVDELGDHAAEQPRAGQVRHGVGELELAELLAELRV